MLSNWRGDMPSLEKLVHAQVAEAPRLLMKQLLKTKLQAAGMPEQFLSDAADQVLKADGELIELNLPGAPAETIHIAITDDDISTVMNEAETLLEKVPDIVADVLQSTTKSMTREAKRRWQEESWAYEAEIDRFRKGINYRWGKAISSLELLLHLSRELGRSTFGRRSKTKTRQYKREVLGRLHVRACQVSDEIIALLRAGFADGAMARWRTLHEICVVILLVSKAGEELAHRYLDHEHVEVKAAIDEYQRNAKDLGAKPPNARELSSAKSNLTSVLEKYGPEFASPYGWAAEHLGMKKPILADLERAVNRRAMRSYYKMASYNVHASARGIMFQLGNFGNSNIAVAGASNAGLDEPGQHAALTLAAINSALMPTRSSYEKISHMGTIVNIRDETIKLFQIAGRKLLDDETTLKRG